MTTRAVTIFNGCYTITSPSGNHRTFEIRTTLKGNLKGKRILALLVGPDNTRSFKGFAFVNDDGIKIWSKFAADGVYEKYAKMLWSLATEGDKSPYHAAGCRLLVEGRCCICNRRLTTPDSIRLGIGPECRSRTS